MWVRLAIRMCTVGMVGSTVLLVVFCAPNTRGGSRHVVSFVARDVVPDHMLGNSVVWELSLYTFLVGCLRCGSVLWSCVVVRLCDSALWLCVEVVRYGSALQFCVVVLRRGSVLWFCVAVRR